MSLFDLERELTQSGKKQIAAEVPELIRRKQDEIYAALAEMEGGAGREETVNERKPAKSLQRRRLPP
ncbi:hypothetical protein CM49_01738 [Paenibacillus sp. P1XP2]|nr:hypothetical protein CM49_01738 [Paenibacillus sp. P1XP2]